MTFNDIFKSSFLENVSEFSILDTVIGLAVALVIGLFIFIIYKKTLTGVLYSGGFALTLVGLPLSPRWSLWPSRPMWFCPSAWWAHCPSSASVPPSRSRWRSCSCSGRWQWAL